MIQLQRYIPVWKEEFQKASDDRKKIMLSYVLDKVIVYRDKIEQDVKSHISQFIDPPSNQERIPANKRAPLEGKLLVEKLLLTNSRWCTC